MPIHSMIHRLTVSSSGFQQSTGTYIQIQSKNSLDSYNKNNNKIKARLPNNKRRLFNDVKQSLFCCQLFQSTAQSIDIGINLYL